MSIPAGMQSIAYPRLITGEDGEYRATALPVTSTLALTPRQRALGKIAKIPVHGKPDSLTDPSLDLLADTFHELYADVAQRDPVPPARFVNHKLLEWIKNTPRWETTRMETVGSLFASTLTADAVFQTLNSDETFAEVMKMQERLEKEQKKVEEAEDQATAAEHAEGEDSKAARQARKNLEKAKQEFKEHSQVLQQRLDKMEGSRMVQASIAQASKKAADAAQEAGDVEAMVGGWGNEDAETQIENTEMLLKWIEDNREWITKIAQVVGRTKDIAMKAGKETSVINTAITEADLTQDLLQTFPDELAKMSPYAPDVLRAHTVGRWARGGLNGWKPTSEKLYEGSFVAAIDVSGSMFGLPAIVSRGTAWGVAQAFKSGNRHYRLRSFSTRIAAQTEDDKPFAHQLKWLAQNVGGGTSFDAAFDQLTTDILDMDKKDMPGVDAMFLSDGQANLSADRIKKWIAAAAQTGARLLYVAIGGVNAQVQKLADRTIRIDRLDEKTGDEIARQLGSWMGRK